MFVKKNKTSREIRNFQTVQQAVLIGLLNQFSDIIFKQPAKKSVTTQQYMRIKSIIFTEEDTVSFAEFLKRRCLEHYNWDITHDVPLKTAKRRYQTNKKTDGLHLMMDILSELGFVFHTKMTEGKSGTVKLENIIEVTRHGKCIVHPSSFIDIGKQINTILSTRMNNAGKEMILTRSDSEIQYLFLHM